MGDIDAATAYQPITRSLHETFGSVVQIARMKDAPLAKADLVALIDLYPEKAGTYAALDAKIIFLTPDGRRIEEVAGRDKQSFYQAGNFTAHPTRLMTQAAQTAANQMRAAMLASPALAAFAKAKERAGAEPN